MTCAVDWALKTKYPIHLSMVFCVCVCVQISAAQRDEVLKLMMEADQENLDRVLRRLSNENQSVPRFPSSSSSSFLAVPLADRFYSR